MDPLTEVRGIVQKEIDDVQLFSGAYMPKNEVIYHMQKIQKFYEEVLKGYGQNDRNKKSVAKGGSVKEGRGIITGAGEIQGGSESGDSVGHEPKRKKRRKAEDCCSL